MRAASQINARAETLDGRPALRNAWRKNRRCVVPTDGFYEWVGPKEALQPIWLHRPDRSIIFFAGLYELWQPSPDTWQRTFTIITTTANGRIGPVHDRMPVIVPEEQLDDCAPGYLTAPAVSIRANSVRNDDPACLEPSGAAVPGDIE
ncbi:MAG: SOS response-associated peptidase [Dehalococcoidia bacterium]